ncbi:peroxisomal membrane protein 11C-like [Rhynchophorus ferrugineus]|uniref:Peroxisomal membrane protein 11C n=1 Tax=Rhynchophorus ferrugineus TaxID=354439 RepID=A0A834IFY1_RHYFE|nr:hypothetical protein GWI33_008652 [Rhynchophorus ferrugineus]
MGDTFNQLLDETCSILESYRGRDKILRVLCYASKLLGELQSNPELAKKFSIFGSQMSATRATLRLLNDLPTLKSNLQYGLGKNEPDDIIAKLGVVSHIIDQIYLPIEKMSWLAKYKLLTGVDNNKWDNASSVCWAITTYLTIIKTVRYLILLQKHTSCFSEEKSISPDQLQNVKNYNMWNLLRLCMDFIHAVNTLPPGFFWSSRLKPWQVNVIATTSSIVGIYLLIYKRWLK